MLGFVFFITGEETKAQRGSSGQGSLGKVGAHGLAASQLHSPPPPPQWVQRPSQKELWPPPWGVLGLMWGPMW